MAAYEESAFSRNTITARYEQMQQMLRIAESAFAAADSPFSPPEGFLSGLRALAISCERKLTRYDEARGDSILSPFNAPYITTRIEARDTMMASWRLFCNAWSDFMNQFNPERFHAHAYLFLAETADWWENENPADEDEEEAEGVCLASNPVQELRGGQEPPPPGTELPSLVVPPAPPGILGLAAMPLPAPRRSMIIPLYSESEDTDEPEEEGDEFEVDETTGVVTRIKREVEKPKNKDDDDDDVIEVVKPVS